jgi:hypothetical protein
MIAMMALLLVGGLLAGAALGLLRFKVFVLIPVLLLMSIAAAGAALTIPGETLSIILITASGVFGVQIGYLGNVVTKRIVRAHVSAASPAAPTRKNVST